MTITVKRSTAAIAIALIGVLGGLSLGSITQATSAADEQAAHASYVSPLEQEVKKMARQLASIKRAVGDRDYIDGGIIDILKEVRGNTYGICQNSGGSPFCHN